MNHEEEKWINGGGNVFPSLFGRSSVRTLREKADDAGSGVAEENTRLGQFQILSHRDPQKSSADLTELVDVAGGGAT